MYFSFDLAVEICYSNSSEAGALTRLFLTTRCSHIFHYTPAPLRIAPRVKSLTTHLIPLLKGRMRSSQDEIFHLILAIKSIRYLSCIFKVFFLILLLMHISKVSICTHAKQSHLDDNKLLTKNTTRREIGGV